MWLACQLRQRHATQDTTAPAEQAVETPLTAPLEMCAMLALFALRVAQRLRRARGRPMATRVQPGLSVQQVSLLRLPAPPPPSSH